MLIAKNLLKSYGQLNIIKGVDLVIHPSEMVAIVGPSGAGKSTLLHLLSGLDKPDSGSILFHNKELTKLNSNQLNEFRNKKIGFIFQFHHLLPEFTTLENVCIPAWIAGKDKKNIKKKGMELLVRMGLAERIDHKPSELSGGEQQRVAIARALINNPEIVFADEPTGNLDSKNAEEINELFLGLINEFKVSFVVVTHNKELAAKANRILTMKDGLISSEV